MNDKIKKQSRKEESFLRQLFHDWDPIVSGMPIHTPMDEYDCLVHKIISALHAGEEYDDLIFLISGEFNDHFGMSIPEKDIIKNAKIIWNWWKNEN